MKKNVLGIVLLSLFISIVLTSCSGAHHPSEDTPTTEKVVLQDLSNYFEGFNGTFVMFDQNNQEYTIYNQSKSELRLPPCSTFKVIHSLFGLESQVLQDEQTTFKWDGTTYPMKQWNKDHSLHTAIQNCVVWYYQSLASQIGEVQIQQFLDKVDYGNNDISGGISNFWLQSSLLISPMEQVNVLRKMYNNQLPFSKTNIDIVKKILVLSDRDGVTLSGKTGAGTNQTSGEYVNGWFIGYVEKEQNVYFFASNIEPGNSPDKDTTGITAKEITLQILKDKNLYSF